MTAVAASAGLVATVGIVDDVGADFALGDLVIRRPAPSDKPVELWGALTTPARRDLVQSCLAAPDNSPTVFVSAYHDLLVTALRADRQDRLNITIHGLPYTPLAFRQDRVCVLSLADDRAVFLVDARLAQSAMRGQPGLWRACLDAMAERAAVLLFHPGRGPEFIRSRRELRGMGLAEPMLFGGVGTDPQRVLIRAGQGLGRATSLRMAVLTDDADLARRAAALRLATHLVAPSAGKGKLPANLKLYESLDQFKDSLAPR
jgi:hypothetical protein